jgi:NADPH:quinone reductase-like Zn-dependent oxidoreductase
MRAAGVRLINGTVESVQLPGPREVQADEILIDVRAAGVGNWDEFVRTGGWDTGTRPPMALGVEAAGIVASVGSSVAGWAVGDRVTAHSAPLREQGSWAEWVTGLRRAAARRDVRCGRRTAGPGADR